MGKDDTDNRYVRINSRIIVSQTAPSGKGEYCGRSERIIGE